MNRPSHLTLGFVPLTDCAPIAVAAELGFFADAGLAVTTSREESWASIRDKVAYGVLDAAQMIAPMPIATTLGIGGPQNHTIVPMALGLNGNAITVSAGLYRELEHAHPAVADEPPVTAAALRLAAQRRADEGRPPPAFGVVFPVSTHNYQLRYWMAAAGMDPDEHARLFVVPPPAAAAALAGGHIDGFCVGEPYNTAAATRHDARILITAREIWAAAPEKVLGLSQRFADANEPAVLALVQALARACRWLDDRPNRAQAAEILARPEYIGVDPETIAPSLADAARAPDGVNERRVPGFHIFFNSAATFPWRSHAQWLIQQMTRWGHIGPDTAAANPPAELAARVYRPDLYRRAAEPLGIRVPDHDTKPEGVHPEPWLLETASGPIEMGPDTFFDRSTFTPDEHAPLTNTR